MPVNVIFSTRLKWRSNWNDEKQIRIYITYIMWKIKKKPSVDDITTRVYVFYF